MVVGDRDNCKTNLVFTHLRISYSSLISLVHLIEETKIFIPLVPCLVNIKDFQNVVEVLRRTFIHLTFLLIFYLQLDRIFSGPEDFEPRHRKGKGTKHCPMFLR